MRESNISDKVLFVATFMVYVMVLTKFMLVQLSMLTYPFG